MTSIKELKKIISSENNNSELIPYIVWKFIEYFHYDYFKLYKALTLEREKVFLKYNEKILNIFEMYSEELGEMLPGEIYESIIPSDMKKKLGQVYTPRNTIITIINNTLTQKKYIENPFLKVLDPSCGSGYFLIESFKKIKGIFIENEGYFNYKYKLYSNNIDEHILKNNIFGYDIDYFSYILSKINLGIVSKCLCEINIQNKDFLFSDDESKYHLIIGNPPYIGHKNLSLEYKKKLKTNFQVYNDKSDISYCFFEKCFDILDEKGELSFITSRYFIEANYALELRNYIKRKYNILSLIDYSGINLFKNTGVSPLIINLSKNKTNDDINIINISNKREFKVSQNNLDSDNWKLLEKEIIDLFIKISGKSESKIGDNFNINQGIISGMDKAFVIDDVIVSENNIEKEILVNWIKGSSLKKFQIEDNKNLKLIYTNDIEIKQYPNTERYLLKNKEKLSNRRECIRGYRKWYDLQWGRNKEQFMNNKIVFPYKSSGNFFALDKINYFFSADIYMMTIKKTGFNLENALYYLNSEVFEFLIKVTAKKIGKNLFEYYPYNIIKLPFLDDLVINFEIINKYGKMYVDYNKYIYEYMNIKDSEINLIKKFLGNK